MKNKFVLLAGLVIVVIIAIFARSGNDMIKVVSPKANELVSSPLVVSGQARGTWYFEASFPVRLVDANGVELAVVPAQAQGDPATGEVSWMTEDFVPFLATLNFAQPNSDTGKLILEKDNPSGLPEHADQVEIPVRFR